MKQFRTIIFTVTGILGAFLAACSDSGTGVTQVETVNELGECEESNEGVTKLVTSEDQYYKCVDGDWEETEAPVQSSSSKIPFFSGGGILKDSRDGQTYRTVKIGKQVWMAENLNYRYLGPTADLDSSSFCYDDEPANCTKYGRLYLWSAAMDSAGIIKGNTANGCGVGVKCSSDEPVRGVCPKGWHLPSWAEWEELVTAVGDSSNTAGIRLKSTSGWYSSGNGTDSFGFSALPAGYRRNEKYRYRYHDGELIRVNDQSWRYDGEGNRVNFWSSTNQSFDADWMYLYYDNDYAYLGEDDKGYGLSVRCLKD